jgi:hypothetical protein
MHVPAVSMTPLCREQPSQISVLKNKQKTVFRIIDIAVQPTLSIFELKMQFLVRQKVTDT